MLTESEREWAIKKSKWIKHNIYYLPEYPTKDELFDAAEFSERVAIWLAEYAAQKVGIRVDHPERVLKAARLAIEEEMDEHNDA